MVLRMAVSMSVVVPGGWYWFSPHELHFRPQHSFESGVRQTVDWYVAHASWWEPLLGEDEVSPDLRPPPRPMQRRR